MALCNKREQLIKRVPWISPGEWHKAYKQIYSNNHVQQMEACHTLMVWKARCLKLPVGVNCTLLLLEVCLKDRDRSPKIRSGELPMHNESELQIMYSTNIMRFLNHVVAIVRSKVSMFRLAKQLKIPEWIVDMRHDAAHGHELPHLNQLRIAANILLTWLHDEYWAPAAKSMKEHVQVMEALEDEENLATDKLKNMIELWMMTGLYIIANYVSVMDLPDMELREMLQNLHFYDSGKVEVDSQDLDVFKIDTAQSMILKTISSQLDKHKRNLYKNKILIDTLCQSEAFFPSSDFLATLTKDTESLPDDLIDLWNDFLVLLQKKKLLQPLFLRLLEITKNENGNRHTRHLASLWLDVILRAAIKHETAQRVALILEQKLDSKMRAKEPDHFAAKVWKTTNKIHPEKTVAFKLSMALPKCLTDNNFLRSLVLEANEFTLKCISSVLKLMPNITVDCENCLLQIVKIYSNTDVTEQNNGSTKIYSVDDIAALKNLTIRKPEDSKDSSDVKLADETVRNTSWKLADEDCDWKNCPIGMVPWQKDSEESSDTEEMSESSGNTDQNDSVSAGMLDVEKFTMESKINWDDLLKKKSKRKRQRNEKCATRNVTMNRAIDIVKKRRLIE